MGYRIAVAGATGTIGREVLAILAEREFPVEHVEALAPRRSLGSEVSFGDSTLTARDDEAFDFTGFDMVILTDAGDEAATRKLAGRAAGAGAVVIDLSPAFRLDPAVPLIVPEVNGPALKGHGARRIVASPDAATAQLAVALAPLHARAGITHVTVTSLHPVSELGKRGMDELWDQTKGMYVPGQEVAPSAFPRQIAFNVLPHVGAVMEDGATRAEWGMAAEMKKLFGAGLRVNATALRVPVFVGHLQAVAVEFADFLDEDEARDLLREAPGLMVVDKREDGGAISAVEAVGDFATYVTRIRQDGSVENGLNLLVVSDNLRKGTALNAVQIAELLGRDWLKKG